jgi:hypothetical protein
MTEFTSGMEEMEMRDMGMPQPGELSPYVGGFFFNP